MCYGVMVLYIVLHKVLHKVLQKVLHKGLNKLNKLNKLKKLFGPFCNSLYSTLRRASLESLL